MSSSTPRPTMPSRVGRRCRAPSQPREVSDLGRLAVVEQAVVGDVVERVDVGVAVAVARHAEEVQREAQPARADVDVVHLAT